MKRRTIREAIIETLTRNVSALSAREIYSYIIAHDLYRFRAAYPEDIVRIEIRRHCLGVDFPTAKENKFFQIQNDGKYSLLAGGTHQKEKRPEQFEKDELYRNQLLTSVSKLNLIRIEHHSAFKQQVLFQLKEIDPKVFEFFSKRLLEAYGFSEMQVTKYVKDGGLDGYGKLKVGITYLNVAFQCKRWKNSSVGRTEVDKFRGAIQGDFEQGIIFTTSNFSSEALNATRKKGAVPIILIDGSTIIDIMIEKRFGVEVDYVPVYVNAIDRVLTDEND